MEKGKARYPVSQKVQLFLYNRKVTELFLTVLTVFVLLIGNEFWWRKKRIHSELSRKFIHITVGSFVAFWPFFLDWDQIKILSIAFVVVVLISKQLNVFQAIHSVNRPTRGEIFFALAVGAIALITEDKWIYMAAVLQMSLADGLAAIIGTRYGKSRRYTVFGHVKSIYGTTTFFVTSILILLGYAYFAGAPLEILALIGLAAAASVIENVGVEGIDNLLVPVLVAYVLTVLV